MSKLLSMLSAAALALSIGGIAAAADNTTTQQQQNQPQTDTQPGSAEQQREQEYLAALKKCDSIANAGQKQKCVDAAKKKHGQM